MRLPRGSAPGSTSMTTWRAQATTTRGPTPGGARRWPYAGGPPWWHAAPRGHAAPATGARLTQAARRRSPRRGRARTTPLPHGRPSAGSTGRLPGAQRRPRASTPCWPHGRLPHRGAGPVEGACGWGRARRPSASQRPGRGRARSGPVPTSVWQRSAHRAAVGSQCHRRQT